MFCEDGWCVLLYHSDLNLVLLLSSVYLPKAARLDTVLIVYLIYLFVFDSAQVNPLRTESWTLAVIKAACVNADGAGLTDSWPGCVPAVCASRSREEPCRSSRFQSHRWSTSSAGGKTRVLNQTVLQRRTSPKGDFVRFTSVFGTNCPQNMVK